MTSGWAPGPLQVGLQLPTAEGGTGGGMPRWHEILEIARTAESIGFDSLWIADHLLSRGPGREPRGVWECWSILSAIAAATTTAQLGPFVTATSFRNPALVAKMAMTVDDISNGRLVLGIGSGWYEPEYRAFGYPFDHRVSRFAEAIEIVHSLLSYGTADFDGRYYLVKNCELRPRSRRSGGPPIMIGTLGGERVLRLAARFADVANYVWLRLPDPDLDELARVQQATDRACKAENRDPATLARSIGFRLEMSDDRLVDARFLRRITAELLSVHDRGFSHIQLWLEPTTRDTVRALQPLLDAIRH